MVGLEYSWSGRLDAFLIGLWVTGSNTFRSSVFWLGGHRVTTRRIRCGALLGGGRTV